MSGAAAEARAERELKLWRGAAWWCGKERRGVEMAGGDCALLVALHLTVDKWQWGVQDGDAAA